MEGSNGLSRLGQAMRLSPHNLRVQFLDDLAALLGCRTCIGGRLPDSKQPDVLRLNRQSGLIFMGDAKHTETPGSQATSLRLLAYLRWLSVAIRADRKVIFALCFGREGDATGWVSTMTTLENEAGIRHSYRGVEKFGKRIIIVWSLFRAP